MPRRSSRILNKDGKKFDSVVRLIHRETDIFVSTGFSPIERSRKIKNIYNIIYYSRELFQTYTDEKFLVRFMKKYIQQGMIILDTCENKSHANICRASVMRTIRYAEKYLEKRDMAIRCAADKISQKTCRDISNMVISFL